MRYTSETRVTMTIAYNRLTRGAIVFLGMILIFDGIRTIGKIPGPGGIVYREYTLVNRNDPSNKEDICTINSYLGHKSVTYVVDDEYKLRTNALKDDSNADVDPVYGSATSDVTVIIKGTDQGDRNRFNQAFNDHEKHEVDSHNSPIEDKCLNYLRQVYFIEWTMFGLFMASLLLLLFSYFFVNRNNRTSKENSMEKKGSAQMFKLIAFFFVVYLILKITRFFMENHSFGQDYDKNDKCLNQNFKQNGLNLLDNYLNLADGTHSISGGVIKTDLEIAAVKVDYDAITHFAVMDGLHVLTLVGLALMGVFNELFMVISPISIQKDGFNRREYKYGLLFDTNIDVEGDMSSMAASMMSANDQILESS